MFSGKQNPSRPMTLSTTVPVAASAASTTGGTLGTNLVTQATSEAMGITAEQLSKANSLLATINALLKKRELNPNVELFPEELQEVMQGTARVVARGTSGVTLAPSVILSNASQLPIDASLASSVVTHSTENSRELTRLEASSLNDNGFSANCVKLSAEWQKIFKKIEADVDEMKLGSSHGNLVNSAGNLSASTLLTTSASFALAFDMIGSIFREGTALNAFSKMESAGEKEKNIYQAWSKCSKAFTETHDLQASLQSLKELRDAISNFHDADQMRVKQRVSAPVLSVLSRSIMSGSFVTALESVIGSMEAIHVSARVLKHESKSNSLPTLSKASTLRHYANEGGVTHFENLSDLNQNFRKMSEKMEIELKNVDQSNVVLSAELSAGLVSLIAAVPSLVAGATGLLTRELSGATVSTKDTGLVEEFSKVSASDKANTGQDLDKLLVGSINLLIHRLEQCKNLGASAPSLLGLSEFATCGALIVSLNTLAGAFSALREWRSISENADAYVRLKVNAAENEKIDAQEEAVLKSNKDTAHTVGTGFASENLSLHHHLHSVIETIVLGSRSSFNPLQPGEEKNINRTGHALINLTQMNTLGFTTGVLGALTFLSLETGILTSSSLEALRQWQ